MKRRNYLATLVVALAVLLSGGAWAQSIQVTLDGRQLSFDQPPVMQQGRVMVPLRGIFESLGAEVLYEASTRQIKATRESRVVELTLGSSLARIDGQTIYLDVPAGTIGGRTMVPLRFVSEALGADVKWQSATRTVAISSPGGVAIEPLPRTPPLAQRPHIDEIVHNGDRNLRAGDVLHVEATGAAGAQVDFSVLGAISGVPMRETGSGRYVGDYTIRRGEQVTNGALVVHMALGGVETMRQSSRSVAIAAGSGGSGGTGGVQVAPAEGSIAGNPRPTVQASFESTLRTETVRLIVDGRDMTNEAMVSYNYVRWIPRFDLARGSHTAHVEGVNTQGQLVSEDWTFHVDATAGIGRPSVQITNLSNGTEVPNVFTVAGLTTPYAQVEVLTQVRQDLIPGLISVGGQTIQDTGYADANGRFEIQVDASSAPSDARLTLQVTASTSQGESNPEVLDLAVR